MPLIAGDNKRNRLKRSAPDDVSPTPIRTIERPTLKKAIINGAKSVVRQAGLIRRSRADTFIERKAKCDKCELMVVKGRGEYCGHRYLDVTLGRVKIDDVGGCGCSLSRKLNDPNESCPRIPPEWVAEPQTSL